MHRSSHFSALVIAGARVFKSGNSLAIRIPQAVAKRIDLDDGADIEMGIDDGMLFIRRKPALSLDALIESITEENVHVAHFGDIAGAERW